MCGSTHLELDCMLCKLIFFVLRPLPFTGLVSVYSSELVRRSTHLESTKLFRRLSSRSIHQIENLAWQGTQTKT